MDARYSPRPINIVVAQPISNRLLQTMITTMVRFLPVGGINFETDTFNWSTVRDVVVGWTTR
jgi:hypothetical protein